MPIKIFIYVIVVVVITSCSFYDNEIMYDNEEIDSVEETHLNHTIGNGPFVSFQCPKFKTALLNDFAINLNKDNEISFVEASTYTGEIDISDQEVSSLVGIEKFDNITKLNIVRNEITTLDLRYNTKLEIVKTAVNPLTFICLEENINLKSVDIRGAKVKNLDFSKNTNLKYVEGYCNFLLETINIKNGNNGKIYRFSFGNSPSLECIQVDNIAFTFDNYWSIPKDANFSIYCYPQ